MRSKRVYYSNLGDDNTLYLSVYKAICIDNVDKQIPNSGRVQVFVPEIHGMRLAQVFKGKSNIEYKFPGINIITDLTPDVLEYLKTLCPWSQACLPVTGGSGPGLYNANSGNASVSEDPCSKPNQGEDPNRIPNPSAAYEFKRQRDPHANPVTNYVAKGNYSGAEYAAPSYSNCPKGAFAVPRVGCILLVTFFKGDPNFPVYIGTLPSADDFSSIYEQDGAFQGYPAAYESKVDSPSNPPAKEKPSKAETDILVANSGGTPTNTSEVSDKPNIGLSLQVQQPSNFITGVPMSNTPSVTTPTVNSNTPPINLGVGGAGDMIDTLPDLTNTPSSNLTSPQSNILPDVSFTNLTKANINAIATSVAAAPIPTQQFLQGSPTTSGGTVIGNVTYAKKPSIKDTTPFQEPPLPIK